MDESPIVHLTFDVSRYLYEKYYPQEIDKFNKKCLNDQFKYFMDIDVYPEFYTSKPIPACHRGGERTHADYIAKWNDLKLNRLDKFEYKFMLQFLKKHYIIIRTTSDIIYHRLR